SDQIEGNIRSKEIYDEADSHPRCLPVAVELCHTRRQLHPRGSGDTVGDSAISPGRGQAAPGRGTALMMRPAMIAAAKVGATKAGAVTTKVPITRSSARQSPGRAPACPLFDVSAEYRATATPGTGLGEHCESDAGY